MFVEVMSSSENMRKAFCISLATEDEDKGRHFDVKMFRYDPFKGYWHTYYVDVKHLSDDQLSSDNYSLNNSKTDQDSMSFMEWHESIKSPDYYLALLLAEGGKNTRKFLLVNTQEVLSRCKEDLDYRKGYVLISKTKIKEKCQYEIIKEEIPAD